MEGLRRPRASTVGGRGPLRPREEVVLSAFRGQGCLVGAGTMEGGSLQGKLESRGTQSHAWRCHSQRRDEQHPGFSPPLTPQSSSGALPPLAELLEGKGAWEMSLL